MSYEVVIKVQISSNICFLMTSMMVFVLKIASINHINKSSTNKVFAGCEFISFRNRFSSCFFFRCPLAIVILIDFQFLNFRLFHSTLRLCQIIEFFSYNTNQVIIHDLSVYNELMFNKSTWARVRLRAHATARASQIAHQCTFMIIKVTFFGNVAPKLHEDTILIEQPTSIAKI